MRQIKRVTALFLSLALLLTMLPGAAWAAETEELPEEAAVTEEATTETDEAQETSPESSVSGETEDDEASETEAEAADEPAAVSEEDIATVSDEQASGTCGENLNWVLDWDGVLIISGTGNMDDYGDYYDDDADKWIKRGDSVWQDYSIIMVVIEEGVTSIGDDAFKGCTELTSITIADTVTSIGDSAFYWCYSLNDITIPSSVTYIGDEAFGQCTSLTSITIPSSVTSMGGNVFCYCDSLTSVVISDGVTSIGEWAFEECTSLVSVDIPDSVTSIGNGAFSGCSSLKNITIPSGVTVIEANIFGGCTSLAEIVIPSAVTTIGSCAFSGCTSLSSISIPKSVSSIGAFAFEDTPWLEAQGDWAAINGILVVYQGDDTTVTVPSGITCITAYAFYDCTSVTSITISNGVTEIGEEAFCNCTSLTDIVIPTSVDSIGSYALSGCENLTTIHYGGTKAQWQAIDIGSGNYSVLATVTIVCTDETIQSGNPSGSCGESVTWEYDTSTGVLTISGSGAMEDYNNGNEQSWSEFYYSITEVVIESGVTSIGAYAFGFYDGKGIWSVTSVTIPLSVTTIGEGAFSSWYVDELSDVYYAGTETNWAAISIGDNNEALTSATIHYNSTTITELTAPTITSLYNSTSGVSVGWDAVDGADSYIVWRLNNSTGKWEKCATTTGTTYLSTSPVSGTTYYYAIEAVNGEVTSGRGTQRYILYMATPKVSLENTTSGIKVSWNSVTGATSGYQVYRRTADTDYELLKQVSTSTTSYTDTTAEAGVRYYYIVRSVRGSARSAYASQYITRLTTPTGISVSNTKSGVQVTWSAVTGATSYQVWRKLSGSSSWSKVGTTTGTSYTSTGVTSGKTYVFTVKAVYNSSVSAYNTTGKTIMRLAEPTITLENLVGGLTASWNAVDGAEGYKLYRRSETGSYVLVATLDADELSYTDKAAAAGVVYYYRVQAYNGSYTSSWTSQFNRRIGHTTLSLAKGEDGVVLTWTKSGGCTGYYIYRMNEDGSYTRIKTITSADTLTWTDTDVDLTSGNAYTYIVRGYNGSSLGSYTPKKTSDFF